MKSKGYIPSAAEIADHCFIAFGAGAATANISYGALRAIRSQYFATVTSLAGTWETDGEAVLLNARELGRICAELARDAGRAHIGVMDFRQGTRELRRRWQSGQFIICPCAM